MPCVNQDCAQDEFPGQECGHPEKLIRANFNDNGADVSHYEPYFVNEISEFFMMFRVALI